MYSYLIQDSCSFLSSKLSFFHDHVMVVLLGVVSTVSYVLVSIVLSGSFSRELKSDETLEGVWTVVPCFVLASVAAPSLMILYLSDEMTSPILTVKVIGHQWYWSYSYDEYAVSFDSYMIPSEKGFRLMEVDKELVVPLNCETRAVVSSSDVIHSWAVPSMGVKMDAIPGRLNQLILCPSRVGKFYGQCSEICGANHSFMPIVVEVIPLSEFLNSYSK